MRMIFVNLALFTVLCALLLPDVLGLQCYTGYKLVGGQGIVGEPKDCNKNYCYNMTATGGFLLNAAKAGCSTYRCLLSRDTCRTTTFQGIPVSFCCCSEDLCNGTE
ncbi:protein C17H12.11 [Aphelenchoides avenae]|nr:protein C17H12.11 [Aphelenchus avenae]